MSRSVLATLGLAALLVGAQAPAPSDPIVAQSGDITLTASAVKAMLDAADPSVREQIQHDPAALTQMVRLELVRRVLLAEALQKKWADNPDVAARIAQARDAVIINSYLASQTQPPHDFPTDADVSAAYDSNKTRFMVPRQYHLAHIFIAVPPGAAKSAEDEALKRARDLRAQAGKPKADFADIAKHGSDDKQSAQNGGDLGWLREDALVQPIKDAVSGLAEGAISEPVRAADGWHVLKLAGTKPAAPATLAEVHGSLVRALRQQRAAQAERALVDETLRRQPARIDEIQLAKIVP